MPNSKRVSPCRLLWGATLDQFGVSIADGDVTLAILPNSLTATATTASDRLHAGLMSISLLFKKSWRTTGMARKATYITVPQIAPVIISRPEDQAGLSQY
jgi:hypothetical protein